MKSKCVIKKSCDLGKAITEFYGSSEEKILGIELEMAITIPCAYCIEKEKSVSPFGATDNKETIEILKSAAGKVAEELWLLIECLSD